MSELLRAQGLTKHFPVLGGPLGISQVGTVRAVDGVDLTVARGEVLGAGRRERLRQVDGRPHGAAVDRAERRQHYARRR